MPMPRMSSFHESCGLQACYPAAARRLALQRAVCVETCSGALQRAVLRFSVSSYVAGETGPDVVRRTAHGKNMVRAIYHIAPGLALDLHRSVCGLSSQACHSLCAVLP